MAITVHYNQLREPEANHAPEPAAIRGCDGAAAGGYPLRLPGGTGRYPLYPVEWGKSYPGSAAQLQQLRADLNSVLQGFDAADDAVLLLSELGANAIRHSASNNGGMFTVRVRGFPGRWLLGEVEDSGSEWHGDLVRSARSASGLNIMTALSAARGVVPCGPAASRTVWFLLAGPAGARGANW